MQLHFKFVRAIAIQVKVKAVYMPKGQKTFIQIIDYNYGTQVTVQFTGGRCEAGISEAARWHPQIGRMQGMDPSYRQLLVIIL